jgi:four helix bundle protein
MHKFKELRIWQEAMALAKMIYTVTANFPTGEKYGLISQLNRAAVSVPSNIAEGAGRESNREFLHFLNIALGSSFEVETQVLLAHSFGFIADDNFPALAEQIDKTQRMINSFRSSITKKLQSKVIE